MIMTGSNKIPKVRRSLKTVNPSLARQWHPTKNDGLTPKDVTPYSGKKVWWRCKKGHKWQARIYSRSYGAKCPYCSGKVVYKDTCLWTINPSLGREWHPTKNGKLTPKDVTPFSHRKIWWRCKKGHVWEATIHNRSNGKGCPYCSGHIVCKDNCLSSINPSLAKQWHLTRNGKLTPKDVTAGANRKVWWRCKKGHEWQAVIRDRNRGTGCPYCCNQKVCDDNCLQTVNPTLAREWHPTLNGKLTPRDVTRGSTKKVWWICNKGHEWMAVIGNRRRGDSCPYCRLKRPIFHHL